MSERERCKEEIWKPRQWRPSRCSRTATLDGYCATHHPDAVAKRAAKAQADHERAQQVAREISDAPVKRAVAARDAEWRAAVERVRESHPGVLAPAEYSVPEARVWARGAESALKSLLAAMEAK